MGSLVVEVMDRMRASRESVAREKYSIEGSEKTSLDEGDPQSS